MKNHANNEIETIIDDFVKYHTRDFDESHDIHHAIAVKNNSLNIAESVMPGFDRLLVYTVSMLHDVRDHKYANSVSEKVFTDFVYKIYPSQANNILKIIQNISYSRQIKGSRDVLPDPLNIYLDIVSDADRLEAIGEVGLSRCIQYTSAVGGKVPEDVIKHCHEKLLRLLPENYITTNYARKIALPLHNYIVEYVDKYNR